ncbi:hypothetical protein I6F35_06570 [Bradyrhizobium sp. BRP22]|uniref:hypothetical protein n=1 Tax=Bradyrhizobium sp. BRP22 TaxID=2793821 RepID=UPI001CD79567|nr:hypothetical protein [Bradyrhizobium sp. BRP22]MCA1452885.1 hypothetical protein [Bradyrhizobium sp. BRP22]
MTEPTLTPRELLRNVIAEVARENDLDPAQITGRDRQHDLVHARVVVAKRLRARGMSPERIAHLMHLHRSTVQFYLGKRSRQRKPDAVAAHKEEVLS